MTSREGSGGRAHRGHGTPPRGRAVRGVFTLRIFLARQFAAQRQHSVGPPFQRPTGGRAQGGSPGGPGAAARRHPRGPEGQEGSLQQKDRGLSFHSPTEASDEPTHDPNMVVVVTGAGNIETAADADDVSENPARATSGLPGRQPQVLGQERMLCGRLSP